jgi:hypothetical protein
MIPEKTNVASLLFYPFLGDENVALSPRSLQPPPVVG